MSELKIKMCPDRKVTSVHKALTYIEGDSVFEYFTECMRSECIAYDSGICKKYNSKVEYTKSTEGRK